MPGEAQGMGSRLPTRCCITGCATGEAALMKLWQTAAKGQEGRMPRKNGEVSKGYP